MPRRKSVNIIREVGNDPLYDNENIQKFINVVMWRGKKSTARRMVYGAFDIIAKKMNADKEKIIEIFQKSIDNITPLIEVRARRIGGSVLQIPAEVRALRGRAIAFRSLIAAASSRSGKTFSERLAYEIVDAYDNKGGAIKAKIDKHKAAEANRAFSHLGW
jgi:small subunit ribosomal protein S7